MAGRAGKFGGVGLYPPHEVDLSRASIARVYDYLLGGKDHFEVDRQATIAMYGAVPCAGQLARDNRNLVRRAVQYLVRDAGMRQIIDLGSGLPTVDNVHEIALAADRDVRVVYVDIDPMVIVHGRALLSRENSTTVITGDARDADSIFDNPELAELIDVDQPVALIATGILQHLDDDEVHGDA